MGRERFAAQRVHRLASRLFQEHEVQQPPWFGAIGRIPPSERIIRPVLQANKVKTKKASKMFQPVKISYPEDELRADFFGDHPWELARPRIVAENDGKNLQDCDWSRLSQPGMQLNGESVVQRQRWLMAHEKLSKAAAYDKARKEFYKIRHGEDVERRMAKEEAEMTGAHFGMSPLQVGMQLEDRAFERWKERAIAGGQRVRAARTAGMLPQDDEDGDGKPNPDLDNMGEDSIDSEPTGEQTAV